jgi:hypothetical protein
MSPFIIYCGFTIYAVGDAEDPEGMWTRTFGANLIGQPDLACVVGSTQEAQSSFSIFENLLAESLQTGERLMNGKTLQLTPDLVLRFTKLSEADRESLDVIDFAKSGDLFVASLRAQEKTSAEIEALLKAAENNDLQSQLELGFCYDYAF